VKESWLDVQLCQEGKEGCEASNNTSPSRVLKFPKRSNEDTVTKISLAIYHSLLYFKIAGLALSPCFVLTAV